MTLIHSGDPKAYALPKLAADIRVTEFRPGMRVRITDTEHQYAGRTGTLEFTQGGKSWVRIGTTDVPVSVGKLEVVAQLKSI